MIGTFIGGLLLRHRAEFNFVAETGCDLGHLSGQGLTTRVSRLASRRRSSKCRLLALMRSQARLRSRLLIVVDTRSHWGLCKRGHGIAIGSAGLSYA